MKLFISYAHVDRYRVNELVDILHDAGYEPWFDHRLLPGQDWKAELLRAVTVCDAFLYALSPESVESEWCQWEFAQAVQMGKPIIPVLLQARTQLPDAIRRFQYADFSEGPTPRSVARLMGGLHVLQVIVPVAQAPRVTTNPSGLPAQAETVGAQRAAPTQTPPDVSHILLPPFEWCHVPQGFVTLEDASSWKPPGTKGGRYEVPSFYIAKYPITNAQYQVFVNAKDGYQNTEWWDYSDHARQWRVGKAQSWDTAFPTDNLPRTMVSWYDAVAFCRWLSVKLDLTPFPPLQNGEGGGSGWGVRLPTEQQWQRAAQGDDGRKYPWGNIFHSALCNTTESEIDQPTPVTQYPINVSPYGVFDMAGNVWEWCLTRWGEDSTALEGDARRAVRGGAWNDSQDYARAVGRYRRHPGAINSSQGFRVVCAPV